MKTLLGILTAFGFIIVLGAAGSADNNLITFGKTLALVLSGMLLSCASLAAIHFYNKRLRRLNNKRRLAEQMQAKKQEKTNSVRETRRSDFPLFDVI